MHIVVNDKEEQSKQLLNLNNLKIKAASISYISSQVFEVAEGGDSRIKVIHYSGTTKTDSVYSTFDAILEQLTGNFMLINKNQIIISKRPQKNPIIISKRTKKIQIIITKRPTKSR